MQGFAEFTEEKKITVKTKMGGEIPATIKVTGKDYHIVKTDSGKQYKVDFKGNSLEEEIELIENNDDEVASRIKKLSDRELVSQQKWTKIGAGMGDPEHKSLHKKLKAEIKARGIKEETDKDLPFTPDAKKTKPSTPGKYGSAYSTVRNLARKALDKQKIKAVDEETEELDERNKENAIKRRMMDASRGARYKLSGNPVPDPEPQHSTARAHNKAIGRALRNEEIEEELDESVKKMSTADLQKHWDSHKDERGASPVFAAHLKRVAAELKARKAVKKEEVDLQESSDSHKVMVTVSDPNHTAVSQRKEQIMKNVIVRATDKGDAQAKAEAFYKKKGYKVHGSEYHSKQPATSMKTEETELEEGYRGSSEADKPYWEAQDHKQAAEKARKSGDHFSYHKFMSAHHDSMAHWSNNKGRTRVADQHMMKSDEHEDYAQRIRKGAK